VFDWIGLTVSAWLHDSSAVAAPHNAYLIMAQIKTDPDASPHLSLFFEIMLASFLRLDNSNLFN
jgi:hypothetical protein